MTISTQYDPPSYVIAGAGPYAFNFNALAIESVVCTVNGAVLPPSSYSVSLVGEAPIYDSGTVTLTSNPLPSGTLEITRSTTLTQEVDYRAYGPFPAETHEFALDKLTLQMQEVATGSVTIIQQPPTTFLQLSDTPGAYASGDAGKLIAVNLTEDGLEFSDTIAGGVQPGDNVDWTGIHSFSQAPTFKRALGGSFICQRFSYVAGDDTETLVATLDMFGLASVPGMNANQVMTLDLNSPLPDDFGVSQPYGYGVRVKNAAGSVIMQVVFDTDGYLKVSGETGPFPAKALVTKEHVDATYAPQTISASVVSAAAAKSVVLTTNNTVDEALVALFNALP